MAQRRYRPIKAYRNQEFLSSRDARAVRIQTEYIEPEVRFRKFDIHDTIVFFGSSRILSRRQAQAALRAAKRDGGDVAAAETALAMSRYYEDARELARRLTEWSMGLTDTGRRFVVCTGGGPGIMEAANRGASDANGLNIGLNISIPISQSENPYVTRHLSFEFHYFFMRKFWFVYLAKALIVFPGGFGTIDELFEVVTLDQTEKLTKPLPIVLYGDEYWRDVVNFDAMVARGTIDAADVSLMYRTDSIDDAYDFIVHELTERALPFPGGVL